MPRTIDIRKLGFDEEHIKRERGHNVTKEQAIQFIKNAKISVTAWKGKYEKYFSLDGATYVDLVNMKIRTAYTKDEYDDVIKHALEVLRNHGR